MSLPAINAKQSPAFIGKLREQDIQRTIIAWLRLKRYFFWRNNVGAMERPATGARRRQFIRFGTPGAPDIFVIRQNFRSNPQSSSVTLFAEIFGIECKAWNGKQSENQRAFEEAFTQAGGIYVLCKSLDDLIMAME